MSMNAELVRGLLVNNRRHEPKRLRLLGRIVPLAAALLLVILPSISFATCPPNCGLAYGVNTTFDAASGADDAAPGDGFCETAVGNGVCTLRAAIEEANAYSAGHGGVSDGIHLNIPTTDPNYNGIFWTVNLAAPLPDITSNMSISGASPSRVVVKRNSATLFRIFNVTGSVTVNISGMTITNGNVGSGGVA